jgi:hypothetical protein
MLMKIRWLLPAGLIFLIQVSLVNCRPVAVPIPVDTGTSPSTESPTPNPTIMTEPARPAVLLPFGEEPSESVNLAKQDLVRRLGVALADITVTAIIGQEFSTNAFYCRSTKDRIAKDDPPAVISGSSILLSVSGRRYEYHASGQSVIFCRLIS